MYMLKISYLTRRLPQKVIITCLRVLFSTLLGRMMLFILFSLFGIMNPAIAKLMPGTINGGQCLAIEEVTILLLVIYVIFTALILDRRGYKCKSLRHPVYGEICLRFLCFTIHKFRLFYHIQLLLKLQSSLSYNTVIVILYLMRIYQLTADAETGGSGGIKFTNIIKTDTSHRHNIKIV